MNSEILVKVGADITGLSRGLQQATKEMSAVSKSLSNTGKSISATGDKLTRSITTPAIAAASALAGITLVKGFQRLVGIDTARAKLTALGHDGDSVKNIMNSALDSVRGTAYGLDEAATTAASAVAAGIKPGQDLTKYLSLAGDAAAIAGVSMGEMGSIFNKVETAQRAYTAELNQLADRGIPIYQWLAEEAGVSAEAIRDAASKGEISAEDFRNAIDKNIGGAAKTFGQESFTAAIANVGAAIGRIGANFLDAGGKGGGFFSTIKPLIGEFQAQLERLEPIAANLGEKFGAAFTTVIDKAKELKAQFDALPASVQSTIAKVVTIGPAILVAIGPAIKIIGGLVGLFGSLLTPIGLVVGAIALIGGAFVIALASSEEFREKVFEAFNRIKDAAVPIIESAFQRVKDLLAQLKTFWDKNGEQIITSVTTTFNNVRSIIEPAIKSVVSFVGSKLSELKAFWDENGAQIMSAVKNVWNGIKAVIDFVMPAILFVIKMVWENIKGVISGTLDVILGLVKVFAGLFTGDFGKMWEGVKQIFFGAIEAVWNAFNLLLYGRLLKAGAALFTGLRTAFANGWTALVGQTKNGIKFVTSSFDDMVRAVRTTFGNVVNVIKTKWDEAMTFLRNIDLKKIGTDIINGLVNGIKAGFTKVKSAVSDLAKLIPDTVANLLGIRSPSRVMMALGNWTGVGMANGIQSTVGANRKAMNELSTVIQGAAKDNAKAIADLAKKAGDEEAAITKKAQQQITEIHAKAKDGKRKLTAAEVRKIAKIEADADAAIVKAKKAHANEIAKIDAESGKKRLDAIQTFVDRKKRLEEISLIDEVNIWRKAVAEFKDGTDEKLNAQEKYRDSLARVNAEITSINETYANKMSDINKRLKDEELALTKAYQDALSDRTKSLMSFAGLFDAFAVEVKQSGAELLSNLQSQVDGFKTWQSEITKLSTRAIDDGLLEELRKMGPDALPQLIALNSLTDEQLSQYSDLYREKAELARTQAEAELIGMKNDTKTQIDALRATANAELAVLQSEWVAKIKGVTQATQTEFKTLTQIGKEAGQNLLDGLKSMESSLVAQATAIARAVNNALQATLGGSAPTVAYATPSASASASGATRATGKTATTPGTTINGVNVTISAKDVAEFNDVVQFFDALPQQIRKN